MMMEEEGEFGSFPDGIDFDFLDEAATTYFSYARGRSSSCTYPSTTTTSTRNPITIKAPYYDDAVAKSTKKDHSDIADNDDSDGDEFGSFPTDLDFSALDKVIAQRLSESQQQQQRSAEVIAVLDDDGTDDTRITLRRNSQYSIDIIVIDDSDLDEQEIAEENKDNNDDDIIIGETLTREQLVKRKFDNAVANGQVIVLEGTPIADVAASNSENTIKRRKVDTYSAAFTQRQQQNQNQSQVIISPEKEQGTTTTTTATTIDTRTTNLTTSQPVFSSTPTAHLKLPTIFNPYKKHRKVNSQAKAKELDETYHTQTTAKVMSVSFTKHNTTYGAFHSSNNNTISKIRNHQKKKRNSIGAASMYCRVVSATNNDGDNVGDCDCGNPHKTTKGKHLCRYFGTYQCTNCRNRWTSSQCWKNETQACKRCNKNNYPICKDKLDGRPPRKIGSGAGHDSARCSRCRRLGYNCRDGY